MDKLYLADIPQAVPLLQNLGYPDWNAETDTVKPDPAPHGKIQNAARPAKRCCIHIQRLVRASSKGMG